MPERQQGLSHEFDYNVIEHVGVECLLGSVSFLSWLTRDDAHTMFLYERYSSDMRF